MFGELEREREKMIKIARKCFETANNVNLNKKCILLSISCTNCAVKYYQVWDCTDCDAQDERWMHHYVLGKINEKNDDNSVLFMDHYLKAAEFLDSYGAIFPKHITYTSPQYYSIEVLEVSTLYFVYVFVSINQKFKSKTNT